MYICILNDGIRFNDIPLTVSVVGGCCHIYSLHLEQKYGCKCKLLFSRKISLSLLRHYACRSKAAVKLADGLHTSMFDYFDCFCDGIPEKVVEMHTDKHIVSFVGGCCHIYSLHLAQKYGCKCKLLFSRKLFLSLLRQYACRSKGAVKLADGLHTSMLDYFDCFCDGIAEKVVEMHTDKHMYFKERYKPNNEFSIEFSGTCSCRLPF